MKHVAKLIISGLLLLTLLAAVSMPVYAQKMVLSEESYAKPPKEIMDVVLAPTYNNATLSNLSPNGVHYLITKRSGLTQISDMAKPFYNLGETEYDPKGNRSRRMTTTPTVGFELFNWKDQTTTVVEVPDNADKVSAATWSPDGSKLAYFAHFDDATHIYIADVNNGRSKKLTKTAVLATQITSFQWTNDSEKILTVLLPDNRGPEPGVDTGMAQMRVRMSRNGATPTRTYRFLLQTPHDEDLLEYYSTGQIALIEVDNGKVQKIGEPEMFRSINMSPNGDYIRVTSMLKPFSYIVPQSNFGTHERMWDMNGNVVIDTLNYRALRIGGGLGDGQDNGGKRNLTWAFDGNGLTYLQQEEAPDDDEETVEEDQSESGRGGRDGARRPDRFMRWIPPFDENSTEVIYEQNTRMSSIRVSEDFQTLFVREGGGGGGRGRGGLGGGRGGGGQATIQRLFAVHLSDTQKKLPISTYNTGDDDSFYKNPGNLMTKWGPLTGSVVRMSNDNQSVYLSGTQYFEDPLQNAPRPFIDRVPIGNYDGKERIFQSSPDASERVSAMMDNDGEQVMVTRGSRTEIDDSYLFNLRTGGREKLTNNVDYTPEITNAQRRRFRFKRVDGFEFNGVVTLPPDYVEGTRLPAMFWFYPREYGGEDMAEAQKSYDERSRNLNKNAFPRVGTRTMSILTKLGYAVVEPDLPIVGMPGAMNNNYVQDLRNSLWAVIDHLDKAEIIDRDRLGIGGHSYGAFGAANAMIHTPFFKAGIAGDGNYNRTLTPMAFQSERRYIWDAREVYFSMSPMLWANQMNGAFLMYHGMDDANTGTFPINSERMFQALNGLDKDASLYMYPYEHHGPASEETLLDLWARWVEWLDIYVKNPEKSKEQVKKIGEDGLR
jgi:dipeptidyl aminopeptidase/acylaminoacyl peptidase